MFSFNDLCKQYLAKYGFVGCPLTEEELSEAFARGISVEEVYSIACDVNAGIPFERAVEVAEARRD
jgi:hypothetical protein